MTIRSIEKEWIRDMQKLFEGYMRFRKEIYPHQQPLFKSLARLPLSGKAKVAAWGSLGM
jgi:hypothetical protein